MSLDHAERRWVRIGTAAAMSTLGLTLLGLCAVLLTVGQMPALAAGVVHDPSPTSDSERHDDADEAGTKPTGSDAAAVPPRTDAAPEPAVRRAEAARALEEASRRASAARAADLASQRAKKSEADARRAVGEAKRAERAAARASQRAGKAASRAQSADSLQEAQAIAAQEAAVQRAEAAAQRAEASKR